MNITLLLAQIYGPILLSIGLGIFISHSFYKKIYRDLEKDALAVLTFGMVAMAVGIIHLSIHNSWGSLPEVLVSIIGWGFLAKGFLFIVYPRVVDKAGDYWANKKLIPIAGTVTLIIGGYLSWIAYLS